MHDIVYILKADIDSEELRYSLRTVEANFPHESVWFFGGCPKWASPDHYVPFEQKGATAWQKSTSTLREICETDGVTEDFWLFNDDFFIMQPVEDLPQMYHGTLAERVREILSRASWSRYAENLVETRRQLEEAGCSSLNYALHVPMLINKEKALEVLDRFPRCPMFRSLYGNYCEVGGINTEDVKIHSRTVVPDASCVLLSTNDDTFDLGEAGRFIRARFTKRSKFEITGGGN